MAVPSFAADGFSSQAASRLLQFRREGKLCDFEFVCCGKRMPVHKVIVCCQSEEFEKEAASDSFELLDTDPETAERMIQYLYTGKYHYSWETSRCLCNVGFPCPENSRSRFFYSDEMQKERYVAALTAQIKLLTLADKYLIYPLAAIAVKEFRYIIYENGLDRFPRFLDVVPQVYALDSHSSKLLRNVCVAAVRDCSGYLRAPRHYHQHLKTARAETPEFSEDIAS